MDSQFVTIRRFPAMIHAELAKSALEAYEIDATIVCGLTSSPPYQNAALIDLMVRAEDVAAALEILGPEERFST
jgi:hypothetical protein